MYLSLSTMFPLPLILRFGTTKSSLTYSSPLSLHNVDDQDLLIFQFCPTLCDSMARSTPCLPVHHQLPGLPQEGSHRIDDAIQPSHVLLSCSPPFLNLFLESGSFSTSQFFASGGHSIAVSASALVLPMNIQDWFPLGWTGLISLQSKGLSRVFNTTIQEHQFIGTQLSLWSNSHIHIWP